MTRSKKVECCACPTKENIHDMFGAGGKWYCYKCKERLKKWDQWPPDIDAIHITAPSKTGSTME